MVDVAPNIDAVDYQRSSSSATVVILEVAGGTARAGFATPTNVDTLWILGAFVPGDMPTVTGSYSGVAFPVYKVPLVRPGGPSGFSVVSMVSAADGDGMIVQWPTAPVAAWYIVGVAGGRFPIDPAAAGTVQAPGNPAPDSAVQVAGTDGTDLRALLTDTAGRLEVSDSSSSAAIGPPGSSPPADAIQVAGTDGTDLRALLTDTAGKLEVIESKLDAAIGALAAASPADAVQVAGTDGTDLRALLTNKQGTEYVIGAVPNIAAGDHPPNELLTVAGVNSVTFALLAAAGAGKRYRLYAVQMAALTSGVNCFLQDSVSSLLYGTSGLGSVSTILYPGQGIPLATNAALNLVLGTGSGSMLGFVAYTLETV